MARIQDEKGKGEGAAGVGEGDRVSRGRARHLPGLHRDGAEGGRLVAVSWVDAYMDGSWTDDIEPDETPVITYGLLVQKTRKWVTLAMTYIPGKAPYWGCLWHIPRGMVKDIREIEG